MSRASELRIRAERHEYPVRFEAGLLARSWEFLSPWLEGRPVAIVTHRRLRRLFGRTLTASWPATLRPDWIEVETGEGAKRWSSLRRITETMARRGHRRDSVVVALGGGVVGDLAGFAASIFQRGIDVIQVPTTVVAQVDSSVGGKTAIDLPQGKNLVGSFHPPRAVLVDPLTLSSLPGRELRAGLAEVVKIALLGDPAFFVRLEAELPTPPDWIPILLTAVRAKAAVVEADERESGPRRSLNLGHTLGHALEAAGGYRTLLHGEAVALGTRFVVRLAERLGEFPTEDRRRVDALLVGNRIAPPWPRTPFDRLTRWIGRDKKAGPGGVTWILPTGIGSWRPLVGPDPDLLVAVYRELAEEGGE